MYRNELNIVRPLELFGRDTAVGYKAIRCCFDASICQERVGGGWQIQVARDANFTDNPDMWTTIIECSLALPNDLSIAEAESHAAFSGFKVLDVLLCGRNDRISDSAFVIPAR